MGVYLAILFLVLACLGIFMIFSSFVIFVELFKYHYHSILTVIQFLLLSCMFLCVILLLFACHTTVIHFVEFFPYYLWLHGQKHSTSIVVKGSLVRNVGAELFCLILGSNALINFGNASNTL